MFYTLENQFLKVEINSFGAEPSSVRDASGQERLWTADPAVWKRHAPMLFPIVGRLKGGGYTLGGKPYQISQHGFARDNEFRATVHEQERLVLELTETAETLAHYPFRFTLSVEYRLEGDTLVKAHTVWNRSEKPLYYELGGHEGYCIALTEGERMRDSYILFPGMTEIHPIQTDENVFLTEKKGCLPLTDGKLYLTPGLFDGDALILDDLTCKTLVLGSDKNSSRVTVAFEGFGYMGIWSKPGVEEPGYVCIEPWSALPDGAYLDSALEHKVGVRQLAAGQQETLAYRMAFEV
ncbi:aldose 1-epimerase family protein [Intestinibacillus massiliensis]|uniref:aldose 1-epimerase family protein n=1 Tax=Intestinibacillus massiliensis TaxID=1871029 RepID=UPI000B357D90|nr:aldose 1-epimerase family protein [Intestinibacillus massiliensis]